MMTRDSVICARPLPIDVPALEMHILAHENFTTGPDGRVDVLKADEIHTRIEPDCSMNVASNSNIREDEAMKWNAPSSAP